jgi:hypothetical protein
VIQHNRNDALTEPEGRDALLEIAEVLQVAVTGDTDRFARAVDPFNESPHGDINANDRALLPAAA